MRPTRPDVVRRPTVEERVMKKLVLVLAVALAGCSVYDSTYWRHPTTGVVVECEASWRDALETTDVSTRMRDYCDRLLQRAGLKQITHDEGKEWERTNKR